MKTLVVYYSLEGNTKYVADFIAKNMEVDVLRLIPEKEYPTGKATKYIWGGKSAVMGDSPILKEYKVNIADYDVIIFGTPVWAGTFAPPLRTFIKENEEALKGKKVAIFANSAGGSTVNCINKITELLPGSIVTDTISLVEPLKKKDPHKDDVIIQLCEKLS